MKISFIAFLCSALLSLSGNLFAQCWKQVETGSTYILALKTDGTIWASGNNVNGNLGDGSNISRNYFAPVGTQNDWKWISAGTAACTAIKNNGSLWTWGKGPLGIGFNNHNNSNVPVQIGSDTDWKQVQTGNAHSIGLKNNGTLWGWSSNGSGQLGLGTGVPSQKTIPEQIGTDSDWSFIASTSHNHTLVLKTNGTLWAFGANSYGQIGDGTTNSCFFPKQVGTDNDWVTASCSQHSIARKVNGSFWVWGKGLDGQLGNGQNIDILVPTQMNNEFDWKDVRASYSTTTARKDDNSLWAWGLNDLGQLGTGNNVSSNIPQLVNNDLDWEFLGSGSGNIAAIKTNNTLWIAGNNAQGQLGDGTTINKNTLLQIHCWPNGIEEIDNSSSQFTIYPNPATDKLNIGNAPLDHQIELYDIFGKLLLLTTETSIDTEQLSRGIYILKCGEQVQRVVIE